MVQHPQNETMPCSRRSHNLVLVSAALVLLSSASIVDGFVISSSSSCHDVRFTQRHHWQLHASQEDDGTTWSKSAANESRFGVRRRVKKVLQRAKDRTGIRNASEEQALKTRQSSTNIVADAASIGGLGGVLVDETSGTVDVALDFDTNGYTKKKEQRKDASKEEEELVLTATTPSSVNGAKQQPSSGEVDAIRSDVPAAVAPSREPLPFELPELTDEQRTRLYAGERVEEQTKMGRDGSGFVVVDVKAPPYVVWECLLDFESYPETIPTVRDVTLLTSTHMKSGWHAEKPVLPAATRQLRHYGTPSLTRAAFTLSKFRLNIAAIHKYRPHPDGHHMVFTLDPDCTNIVLKSAKGVWYTQASPEDRGEEYTRVWLLCELRVSRALPSFIVDYAAKRAMPRASSWLKPQVETAANLWLKNGPPSSDAPML